MDGPSHVTTQPPVGDSRRVVAARVRVVVEGRLARRPHEIAENAPRHGADRRAVRKILERIST